MRTTLVFLLPYTEQTSKYVKYHELLIRCLLSGYNSVHVALSPHSRIIHKLVPFAQADYLHKYVRFLRQDCGNPEAGVAGRPKTHTHHPHYRTEYIHDSISCSGLFHLGTRQLLRQPTSSTMIHMTGHLSTPSTT